MFQACRDRLEVRSAASFPGASLLEAVLPEASSLAASFLVVVHPAASFPAASYPVVVHPVASFPAASFPVAVHPAASSSLAVVHLAASSLEAVPPAAFLQEVLAVLMEADAVLMEADQSEGLLGGQRAARPRGLAAEGLLVVPWADLLAVL